MSDIRKIVEEINLYLNNYNYIEGYITTNKSISYKLSIEIFREPVKTNSNYKYFKVDNVEEIKDVVHAITSFPPKDIIEKDIDVIVKEKNFSSNEPLYILIYPANK